MQTRTIQRPFGVFKIAGAYFVECFQCRFRVLRTVTKPAADAVAEEYRFSHCAVCGNRPSYA